MQEFAQALRKIRKKDRRFSPQAYVFVFEALRYGQTIMGLGAARIDDESDPATDEVSGEAGEAERHMSGQDLCEAIRRLALDQFGYMAKCVLNHWGITKTGDFGDIVFHLISAGQMRKTPQDRREDFENVFDFDHGLVQAFHITKPNREHPV